MKIVTLLALSLVCSGALAGDDTVDAAIGGGVGGAVGAAIGEELGDRNGAIVGGAIGGAVGAAIATKDQQEASAAGSDRVSIEVTAPARQHPARHCPPGLAKKGRC